jgi:hypothetical protein
MKRLTTNRSAGARGWLLPLLLAVGIGGCVEESLTPAVFDVVLESTTFENRLRAPVIIFRDNVPIDTMPAGSSRTYPLGRKGAVRHVWQLIAPFGSDGRKAGEEPRGDLGVQYQVNQSYRITNSIPRTGLSIFTPRVSNAHFSTSFRLIANFEKDDQRITNYLIPPNSFTTLDSAPYFYWNSNSNVVLDAVSGFGDYQFSRSDTGRWALRLDDGFSTQANLKDAGVTEILYVP